MTPQVTEAQVLLNFPDAIREVLNRKKLTRVVWDNPQTYIFLQGDILSIHLDNQDHQLIVSVGDMEGIDWYTLPEETLQINTQQ